MNGHGGKEQAHDADGDVHGNGTEPACTPRADAEDEVAHERDAENAKVKSRALREIGSLIMQKDCSGNRARTRQHRDS